MPEKIRCDGETVFGFTVKACDKPATRLRVRNGTHEYYDFCEKHYFFYQHGEYPDGTPGRRLLGKTDGQDDTQDKVGNG